MTEKTKKRKRSNLKQTQKEVEEIFNMFSITELLIKAGYYDDTGTIKE